MTSMCTYVNTTVAKLPLMLFDILDLGKYCIAQNNQGWSFLQATQAVNRKREGAQFKKKRKEGEEKCAEEKGKSLNPVLSQE